jgi:hypothetical protein
MNTGVNISSINTKLLIQKASYFKKEFRIFLIPGGKPRVICTLGAVSCICHATDARRPGTDVTRDETSARHNNPGANVAY